MKYNEIGNENKINEIDIKKMLVSQRPITRIRQKFFWEKKIGRASCRERV